MEMTKHLHTACPVFALPRMVRFQGKSLHSRRFQGDSLCHPDPRLRIPVTIPEPLNRAVNFLILVGSPMRRRDLRDVIQGYLGARAVGAEQNFVSELVNQMQEEMHTRGPEDKMDIVQQLIFLNLRGHDTTLADFWVLEVMTFDAYGAKRIAYTAASQMWNSTSPVVLMAINRIQRDLTSVHPLLSSLALSSVPPYLSLDLSRDIAADVISLMSAARPVVRQKAIIAFYHICLRYPDALRPGFTTLKQRLDDPDNSVVL
jgi:hypothetical protein